MYLQSKVNSFKGVRVMVKVDNIWLYLQSKENSSECVGVMVEVG